MSEKHEKVDRALNYFEHFVIFISAVSGCVSISPFASLVGVPVGIARAVVRIKICAITAGIKRFKSIIKKKRKKHGKLVLLGKAKLDTIKVLISKSLFDPYISHDKLVLGNNLLREYNDMKEEIKNPENDVENTI